MIDLKVLVPEATQNYVQNPAFRYDTAGWTVSGSTLTRTLDFARFGIASGKVVTAGSVRNEGVFYRVSNLTGVPTPITVSVYVRGAGKVRIRLLDNPFGKQWSSDPAILESERWTRLEVSGYINGSNDVRLYVESAEATAKAITFYADGAQMEKKSYATTFCDGDQPGCRWNNVDSGSMATRNGNTREGGRWVPIAGPSRLDQDVYVTVLGGLGMAPIMNNLQSWANAPGGYYQSTKISSRVVTLNFFAKNSEVIPENPPPSLVPLHQLRQQLIDLFKHDKTIGGEAFWFEYSDTEGQKPLYLRMRYEAGLDGSWDIRNGFFNAMPVRMIASDPLFVEDNQNAMQLVIKNKIPIPSNDPALFSFYGSKVTFLANAVSSAQMKMAEGLDGTIYIGSGSTILTWDGDSLDTFVTADNTIKGLAFGLDGTLYACGSFTTINGVAATRIARRNPTTGVWSAMGTGLNADAETVCVAQNGQVYVGGSFTTAGGVACLRIARWDGLQWRTVGATSGVSGTVSFIVKGRDSNTLYMGGQFLTNNGGGITYNAVASIDVNTNLLSVMGDGLSGASLDVQSLAVGLDGTVYAGGAFESSGGNAVLNVAQFVGDSWKLVGAGLDSKVFSLAIGKNGELYASGQFLNSGNKSIQKFGKFVSNTWTSLDIFLEGIASVSNAGCVFVSRAGEVFLQYNVNGSGFSATIPAYNTITNEGSAQVYPKLYIKGQGTLRSIINTKTGESIYMNLPVYSNEEVFIDFARSEVRSVVRGDLLFSVLPGSEVRAINLLPGENEFGVLVTDDVNCIVQLRYTPTHWSADAIADVEDL